VALNAPFDPGLQPERTSLAWQRTLLALTVGMLAASRGLLSLLGPASYVIAGAGLVVVALLAVAVHRRYRGVHEGLTSPVSTLPGAGRLVAAAAILTVVCGVAAAAFVLATLL
jgi:hypothetical protein